MPQFQLANFLPQMVWLAIFFAILYFGIVRLTLPKVGRVMQAREDQVAGDVATAEQAKTEADRMAADYDADVASAQDAARARLGNARAAAASALEAKLNKSNDALAAKSAEAQAALDTARDAAFGQIESVAADAAADIVERLTGKRPGGDAAAKAARTALA
ncbi:MAG: ATPase [Sphingomonas sp.]